MSVPKIYGSSLYSLASAEGEAERILDELKSVGALLNEYPDYVKILDSPQIDRNELTRMLREDFSGRVSRYTLNFIRLLCEKHMVHYFDECLREYERLYNENNNISVVNVTTAKPMSKSLTDKLTARLEEKTGGRIILKKHVDESCIGGIIIETDKMRIDSSVKSRLEEIKKALL